MKNFISALKVLTMVLAIVSIFIPVVNCYAYDRYVGTYEDGYDAYLMTETLVGKDGYNFRCTVKATKYDDFVYIGYTFWLDGAFYVKSSQGFFGEVDKYKTPVVYNLTRFVQSNFRFR